MDWLQLFDDNGITYVTRGPNTKRGEVSVNCPFCGDEDPSQHLGINLTSGHWGCLRNARHRGKSPGYFLSALLRCSVRQANMIVRQYDQADPDSLPDAVTLFSDAENPVDEAPAAPAGPLLMPREFKHIEPKGLTQPYWNYLIRRGFPDPTNLIRYWGLKACLIGRWKQRLIIPLFGEPRHQGLMGWTSRAITKTVDAPRYLSNSEVIKTTVLNFDNLRRHGGDLLTVVEGPMDALKLDYFGERHRARATCLFGANMTTDQAGLINELCSRFKHVALMLDPDAVEQSFDIRDWLIKPNVSLQKVPEGVEDPGAMGHDHVQAYLASMNHYILKRKM